MTPIFVVLRHDGGLVYDIPSIKQLIDRIRAEAEQMIQTRLAGIAAIRDPQPQAATAA